jgi:hypothetical protein
MKNKLLILIFSFVGIALHAQQQDGKYWLEKMNERYLSAKSLSMGFGVEYYASAMQGAVTTTMKGSMKYSGENYYSDAMGQIVLINKKYTVVVDKNGKTITCLENERSSGKKKDKQAVVGQPDSLWAKAAKIKLLPSTGSLKLIELSGEDPIYEKTVITLNSETMAMEQVDFYYKKIETGARPKLIVKYTNVKFDSEIGDSEFSEKKFVVKKGGDFLPAAGWEGYKIVTDEDVKGQSNYLPQRREEAKLSPAAYLVTAKTLRRGGGAKVRLRRGEMCRLQII